MRKNKFELSNIQFFFAFPLSFSFFLSIFFVSIKDRRQQIILAMRKIYDNNFGTKLCVINIYARERRVLYARVCRVIYVISPSVMRKQQKYLYTINIDLSLPRMEHKATSFWLVELIVTLLLSRLFLFIPSFYDCGKLVDITVLKKKK